MARKMKACKTCGERIANSAKRCPHCGAKQGGGFGKIIGTIILVVLVLGIIGSVMGGDDDPKRVDKSTSDNGGVNAVPASGTEQQNASEKDAGTDKNTFGIGESVSLNDVVVTLVDVSESNGKDFFEPQDGKIFVICEFEIENNSDKEIAVSSLLSFDAYIDDYSTNINISAISAADKPQLDGTIAAGKKMNGIVGYEADAGWSNVEIRFTPDFWSSKEIVFVAEK